MGAVLIAGLAFVTVTAVVVGVWWVFASKGTIQARLIRSGQTGADSSVAFLRTDSSDRSGLVESLAAPFPWMRQLERLTEQAGWEGKTNRALGLIVVSTAIGGLIGVLYMHSWPWGILLAAAGGLLPVFYLRFLRQKRIEKFSEQFPEALDMMTRSLRTGYAVGASFQLVAEEMPDPVATEFRRVFEQIALARPTTEALKEMYERVKTEDVRFFYVALGIQREVGGNLAEILEKLAEVVRERYKLLAFAQAISAQQRATAYCVAASPFVVAILISLTSPGWFDAVWEWQYWKPVVFGVLLLQVVGFYILKRIADIKV